MASTANPASTPTIGATSTPKQKFLEVYEDEHAKTMRVLRAYPADKAELRPHAMCKTARELAWVFAFERRFFTFVFNDGFASGGPPGQPPAVPESWDAVSPTPSRRTRSLASSYAPRPTSSSTRR